MQIDYEARYKSIYENAPVGIFYTTLEGDIIDVNPAAAKILGYCDKEELIEAIKQKSIARALWADPSVRDEMVKVVEKTGKWEKEGLEFLNKKGKIVVIDLVVSAIANEPHVFIESFMEDVTRHIQLEDELRMKNNVFNCSISANSIADLKGNLTQVNKSFLKMWGYHAKEDVIGKNIREFLQEEKVVRDIIDTLNMSDSWIGEYIAVKGDKSTFMALGSATTLRDEDGNKIGYQSSVLDITLRKQAIARWQQSMEQMNTLLDETIAAMSEIVESKDPYTAGHQKKVQRLACAIADKMGLSEHKKAGIRVASLIHDIGKIAIPADILSNPGKLNHAEMELLRTHASTGYDIVSKISFPWPIADIIVQHHERLDGSGYPHELKEGDILLESKILAVADVVEAMASHRPYRPAMGVEAALEEIKKERGTFLDKDVVDACVKLLTENGFTI